MAHGDIASCHPTGPYRSLDSEDMAVGHYFLSMNIVHFTHYGDIAQLARAPALQAGGPGFESLYLHQDDVIILYHIVLVE